MASSVENGIPVFDIEVDRDNFRDDLLEMLGHIRPQWPKESIKIKHLKQGMVNHVVGCYITDDFDEETIVARIWGRMFGELIPRAHEKSCNMCFAELGLAPKIHCLFKNGMCTAFLTGRSYSWDDISDFRDIEMGKRVARVLATYHSDRAIRLAKEKYNIGQGIIVLEAVDQMMAMWPIPVNDPELNELFYKDLPSKEELLEETEILKEIMTEAVFQDVLCHGDVNPTNIIINETSGKLTFVDYDAAGIKSPIMDLVSYLMLSSVGLFGKDVESLKHSPEYERAFIREYLEALRRENGKDDAVKDTEVERYYVMVNKMFAGIFLITPLFTPQFLSEPKPRLDKKEFIMLTKKRLQYYFDNKRRIQELKVPKLDA